MTTIYGANTENPSHKVEIIGSTARALHVAPGGAIVAAGGVLSALNLSVDSTAADVAANRYDSGTGCKAFRFALNEDAAVAGNLLVYGWDTSAGSFGIIDTLIGTLKTEIATPTGASIAQVAAVLSGALGVWPTVATDWVVWDGVNRIKTIVPETDNAITAIALTLEVIE